MEQEDAAETVKTRGKRVIHHPDRVKGTRYITSQ